MFKAEDLDTLSVTLTLSVMVPKGSRVQGSGVVLPDGEVLRPRPVFELCDDERGEYLDLSYEDTVSRGVFYEIVSVALEPAS